MKTNLCIIPARGGSKRIPHKNIKHFLGKPIIAYSIETAIKSMLFDEIMVSTDDAAISQIALQYGAKVPFFRRTETSNDFATLSDVITEASQFYLNNNLDFANICCILPTAPFATVENLKKGLEMLEKYDDADYVRPLVRFSFPIQRALRLKMNKSELFYPEFINTRSQDLEPAFHDSGQFYWMRFKNGLNGTNLYGFEIPESLAQDIDTEEDWKIAEQKYKLASLDI
ncbi:MAG: pseudaminic acid cytidylyltransferase [Prolixibacteraceae bacterium]